MARFKRKEEIIEGTLALYDHTVNIEGAQHTVTQGQIVCVDENNKMRIITDPENYVEITSKGRKKRKAADTTIRMIS